MDDRDEESPEGSDGQQQRVAVGIALGMSLGVALSLALDNWAMVGVGIALGVAFGAVPTSATGDRRAGDGDDPTDGG